MTMNNIEIHGLSKDHLLLLKNIFSKYKEHIDSVGLFGSRATGAFKPYSDLDIVIFGSIKAYQVDNIRTLFLESSIPFEIDCVNYENLTSYFALCCIGKAFKFVDENFIVDVDYTIYSEDKTKYNIIQKYYEYKNCSFYLQNKILSTNFCPYYISFLS